MQKSSQQETKSHFHRSHSHRTCDDPLLVEAHVQGGAAVRELTAGTPGLEYWDLVGLEQRDHRAHAEACADADLLTAWWKSEIIRNRNQLFTATKIDEILEPWLLAHNLSRNLMKCAKNITKFNSNSG